MFRFIVVVTLIHISSTVALSDDLYGDDPALYMEAKTSKYRSQKPFHTKDEYHGLDDNFFRYGRSQSDSLLPFLEDLDQYEESNDEFARPTRSQDRNDNFVRFGRGNSDFLRFGRESNKYPRDMRSDNFLRFGRSILESEVPKKRSRRDVADKYELKDKRGDRDNFLRFGRGGDDSFIRYGRNPDGTKISGDETLPAPTKSHPSFTSNFVHGQSVNYPFFLNGRLFHNSPLLNILRKLEEEMRQNN